jgi:hypothetical protein
VTEPQFFAALKAAEKADDARSWRNLYDALGTEVEDRIGGEIGIDWETAPFDVEQFRKGMDVELEHGVHDLLTNVSDDDPLVTGKIALAHLNEFADYYTRLERMEEQALREHGAA